MVEYRLEDLARISGVSARNIRAYRERGLLDSPRRVGRSAYYGERHLAQLTAISQLLAKGFNSAHIAEFFSGLRGGKDLADTLGIEGANWRDPVRVLSVDAADDDVRTLIECGLARIVDGEVELTDPALVAMVAGAADERLRIRDMARVARVVRPAVHQLAESTTSAVTDCQRAQPGAALRELARAVVSAEVQRALHDGLAPAE